MSDVKWQEDALAAEGEESSLLTRNDLIRAAAVGGAALAAGGTARRARVGALAQRPSAAAVSGSRTWAPARASRSIPGRGSNFIDASRYYNLYDPLVRVRPDLTSAPGLALEWIPNKDSTQWLVRLRPESPSTTARTSRPTTSSTRSARWAIPSTSGTRP